MSKIDDFQKAKRVVAQVRSNLMKATGRTLTGERDHDNDKRHLSIRYSGKHIDDFNAAVLYLGAHYGYYGSSSGYSAMDSNTAIYMVRAINEKIGTLADRAIELAEADAEKARKVAEEEARAVLTQVKEATPCPPRSE